MPKPPKALLERAVKATQLYCGSAVGGSMRVRDQQKLYDRMERAITAVVRKTGLSDQNVSDQIHAEARKRGCISPLPGHHY